MNLIFLSDTVVFVSWGKLGIEEECADMNMIGVKSRDFYSLCLEQ